MKLLNLSLRSLWARPWLALLGVLLLAGGLAGSLLGLLAGHQIHQAFDRDQAGVDLVVGAKGEPTRLVMANLYQLELPAGELSMAQVHVLQQDTRVAKLVPLALADNFRGYRIVGTTVDYISLYGATLAGGQPWRRLNQTVVGAEVARVTGIQVNNTFIATHGLAATGGDKHKQAPLRVVGVLAPCGCVLDRLVLTPLESVWYAHDDSMTADDSERDGQQDAHRTVSAALLRSTGAMATQSLPAWVEGQLGLQAASAPIELTHWLAALTRDSHGLHVATLGLLLLGTLGCCLALLRGVRAQQADYALLNLLGAPAARQAGVVLCQAAVLALLACGLGLLGGHVATDWLGQAWQANLPVRLSGRLWLSAEWLGLLLVWALVLLAAAWPARCAAQASAHALTFPGA